MLALIRQVLLSYRSLYYFLLLLFDDKTYSLENKNVFKEKCYLVRVKNGEKNWFFSRIFLSFSYIIF